MLDWGPPWTMKAMGYFRVGIQIGRLHQISMHGFVVPAGKGELFRLADGEAAHPCRIQPGDASGLTVNERVQVGWGHERLEAVEDGVANRHRLAHVALGDERRDRTRGNVDREQRSLPFVLCDHIQRPPVG